MVGRPRSMPRLKGSRAVWRDSFFAMAQIVPAIDRQVWAGAGGPANDLTMPKFQFEALGCADEQMREVIACR